MATYQNSNDCLDRVFYDLNALFTAESQRTPRGNLFKTRIGGSVKGCNECDFAQRAVVFHLIEKTGNIAAFQRQLGHTNTAYSIQYARVADPELVEALNDR